MKRIIVTLALLFSATFTFAADSKENIKIETPKENAKLPYPSGSTIYSDACGNEYELSWSCNYDCENLDVIIALNDWMANNSECGV